MARRNVLFIKKPPATGGNLLLDDYPGSVQCVSYYRRRQAYTGACMRIIREDDSSPLEVPFNGDFIDTSLAIAHCSGTRGMLETWYDQSGNGNDFNWDGARPVVVSGGAMTATSGGVLAVNTESGSSILSGAISALDGATCSKFWIGEIVASGSGNYCALNFSSGGTFLIRYAPNGFNVGTTSPPRYTVVQGAGLPNTGIIHGIFDGSVSKGAFNDGAISSSAANVADLSTHGSNRISLTTGSDYHAEFILWVPEQESNHAGIRDALNADYSIY